MAAFQIFTCHITAITIVINLSVIELTSRTEATLKKLAAFRYIKKLKSKYKDATFYKNV